MPTALSNPNDSPPPVSPGASAAFAALLQGPLSYPAAAAALVILENDAPPPLQQTLDRAFRAIAGHLSSQERGVWVNSLADLLQMAGVTAPRCVAAFLGQCAVESAGFRHLEEDLYYSAERLCEVWPNRFPTMAAAEACALLPEHLANRVYADRMGNGGEASGDGWRFRGRGLIQITGRTAYQHFADAVGMPIDQAVEHAATQAGAAASAVWFWNANQLNALANSWSLDRLTQKINGGQSGAAERNRLCDAALAAIGT